MSEIGELSDSVVAKPFV